MEGANIINILSHESEKLILSTHTDLSSFPEFKTFMGIIYKFLIRFLYKKANVVVAVSKEVAKSLLNLSVAREKLRLFTILFFGRNQRENKRIRPSNICEYRIHYQCR